MMRSTWCATRCAPSPPPQAASPAPQPAPKPAPAPATGSLFFVADADTPPSVTRSLFEPVVTPVKPADDVAQDAFLVGFEQIAEYRGEGSFGGWIKKTAARLYLRSEVVRIETFGTYACRDVRGTGGTIAGAVVARVTGVLVAFVHHRQHRGMECGGQAVLDLVFHTHVRSTPF